MNTSSVKKGGVVRVPIHSVGMRNAHTFCLKVSMHWRSREASGSLPHFALHGAQPHILLLLSCCSDHKSLLLTGEICPKY